MIVDVERETIAMISIMVIRRDPWAIGVEWKFPGRPVIWGKLGVPTDSWKVCAQHVDGRTMTLAVKVVDGRPRCVGLDKLRRNGHAIEGRVLKDIPLQRLVRRSAIELAMSVLSTPDALAMEPTNKTEAQLKKELAGHLGSPRVGRPRGEKLLRMVDIYKREIAAGNNRPRKVIATELGMNWPDSSDYIGQRIGTARKRGLLPPAPSRGKAGVKRAR